MMATKLKPAAIEAALTAAIAALPANDIPPSCAEIHARREDWLRRTASIDAQLRQALTEDVALDAQERDGLLADADPAALKQQRAAQAERRQTIADLELIRSKMPQRLEQLDKEYAREFAKAQAAALRELRRLWDGIALQALDEPIPVWQDSYLAIAQIIGGLAARWCELAVPPGAPNPLHRRVEADAGEPVLPAYDALPTGLTVHATLGDLVTSVLRNRAVQRRLGAGTNGHRSA